MIYVHTTHRAPRGLLAHGPREFDGAGGGVSIDHVCDQKQSYVGLAACPLQFVGYWPLQVCWRAAGQHIQCLVSYHLGSAPIAIMLRQNTQGHGQSLRTGREETDEDVQHRQLSRRSRGRCDSALSGQNPL